MASIDHTMAIKNITNSKITFHDLRLRVFKGKSHAMVALEADDLSICEYCSMLVEGHIVLNGQPH